MFHSVFTNLVWRFSAIAFGCLTCSFAISQEVQQSGTETQLPTTHFQWTIEPNGVSLMDNGALVLRFEFVSGHKPIVYPIIGPGGLQMTRDFPMKPAEKWQTKDHLHHRSLWMTHGDLNGIDFWAEGDETGRVVHESIVGSETDKSSATLVTTTNWVTPDGKKLLHEHRTMIVAGDAEFRTIEFQIDLTANAEPVTFGDTKEGSFALRVPDSMAVDQKLGGTILNEHGERDDEAWGKRARWVDYSGPVNEQMVGITILEHPTSFGHPCRWHVRTYGLFAANPFGEHHFVGGEPSAGHTIEPGVTMHLQFKLLLHAGPANAEVIEANWKHFAGADQSSNSTPAVTPDS